MQYKSYFFWKLYFKILKLNCKFCFLNVCFYCDNNTSSGWFWKLLYLPHLEFFVKSWQETEKESTENVVKRFIPYSRFDRKLNFGYCINQWNINYIFGNILENMNCILIINICRIRLWYGKKLFPKTWPFIGLWSSWKFLINQKKGFKEIHWKVFNNNL